MTNNNNNYLDFEGLKKYNTNIKNIINEKDLSLQLKINETNNSISKEKLRAENVESILSDNLRDEIARAEKAELDLSNNINFEVGRLSNLIDSNKISLQTNIDKEEASRVSEIMRVETKHVAELQSLDNSLQSFTREQIAILDNNLTSDYQTADESIRVDLRAEAIVRENKDTLHDNQIAFLDGKIDDTTLGLNDKIDNLNADYIVLNNKVLSHIDNINNPHNVTKEQLGAASQDDHNALEGRVSTLESNSIFKTPNNGDTTQTILSGIDIDGNVNIKGDLTFNGKAHTIDTETLQVKDNFITVNSDNQDLGLSPAGIAIQTGTTPYIIAYDKENDSVSLGVGVENDGSFAFKDGEKKPILTRAQSSELQDKHLLIWDAKRNIAIDGGLYDEESLKDTFATWNAYNELVSEVHLNDKDIENLQLGTQTLNKFLQDEANSLKTNVKSISGGINEIHDQLESHELRKDNPHNVLWSQINHNALSDSIPYMDGHFSEGGYAGSSTLVSRADHSHPIDTSRAPVNHASASNIYGQATTTEFGHVKVDDVLNINSSNPLQNKIIAEALNKKLDLIEPSYLQTEFIMVERDYNGYRQVQRMGTFTPQTSYGNFMPVLRGMQGQLKGQTPPLDKQTDLDLINRGELTEKLNTKLNKIPNSDGYYIYAQRPDGSQHMVPYSSGTNGSNIAFRTSSGQIKGVTPEEDDDLVIKSYVDGNISNINKSISDINSNIVDVRSAFAASDLRIVELFQTADTNLNASIIDSQKRIAFIESTNQNAIKLNESIENIINDIKNGGYSSSQQFILSFIADKDSAGNLTGEYSPKFSPFSSDINAGILE